MKELYIANPKGGCGKTTLATQIASYYACEGLSVVLVDHDVQQSSTDWLKRRPRGCPAIASIAAYQNEWPTHETFDFAIHDMPAGCSVSQLPLDAESTGKLLIPVLPSPTDIAACLRFLTELNGSLALSGVPGHVGLIANRVRLNYHYASVLLKFLDQVNLTCVAYLRDSQNYVRVMEGGASIFDLPPGRLTRDLKQWEPLLTWIDS